MIDPLTLMKFAWPDSLYWPLASALVDLNKCEVVHYAIDLRGATPITYVVHRTMDAQTPVDESCVLSFTFYFKA